MTDIRKSQRRFKKDLLWQRPADSFKKLGVSIPTMLRYIKNAKIKMKGAGRKKGQTKL